MESRSRQSRVGFSRNCVYRGLCAPFSFKVIVDRLFQYVVYACPRKIYLGGEKMIEPETMKAITLYNPHAMLVAWGEKKFETRSWGTKYRGPLAIHAAKRSPVEFLDLEVTEPFYSVLTKHDYWGHPGDYGKVIAVVDLVDCYKIGGEDRRFVYAFNANNYKTLVIQKDSNEYFFGDYTLGRYVWKLENPRLLKEPIPAKGMQRIWNFTLPEGGLIYLDSTG